MAPDCEHPNCHEAMKLSLDSKPNYETFNKLRDCVGKKATKKALWIGLIVIGLPLFGMGAGVWSQQESDYLRYADKEDMVKIQVVVEHLSDSIKEMKQDMETAQDKAQKDREEILRRLEK